MATGSELSSLYVRIGADTSGLQQGIAQAKSSLSGLGTAAYAAIKTVAGVGLAATAAVGGMIAFARSGFDAIDSMAKFSDSLGISTEALTSLRYAAQTMAGVGSKELDSALQSMTRRVNEAASGSGQAKDALKALGVSASELARLSPDQQFLRIADAMQGISNQGDRVRATIALFDRSSLPLVNALAQGSEAIREAQAEAEALGMTISRLDAAKIEAANDAFARFENLVAAIQQQMAVAVAPLLTAIADKFDTGAINARKFGEWTVEAMRIAARAVAGLMDAFHAFEITLAGVEVLGRAVSHGIVVAMDTAARAIAALGQGAINVINTLTDGINNIPGVKIPKIPAAEQSEFVKSLGDAVKRSESLLLNSKLNLQDLVDAPSATRQVDQFFEDVYKKSQELKDVFDVNAPATLFGNGEDDDKAAKGRQRYLEQLQAKLELLREHVASETELEIKGNLDRQEQLREIYEQGLITDEERKALALELEQKHQEDLTAIVAKGEEERNRNIQKWAQTELQMRGDVTRQGIALLDQFAGKSKAAAIASIALSKGLAIAETIINTQSAAMRALAELGPIAGPPVASAIEKLGMVKVGIIAATGLAQAASVGGGSSSSLQGGASGSIGGNSSAPSSPVPAATPERASVTINLQGNTFDQKSVRDLIQQINEAVGDGARLRVV